jgi:hypothetical protein
MMNTYETIATVEAEGQIHIAGVPFDPGTQVEIIIRQIENGTDAVDAAHRDRSARLLAALSRGRNSEAIGPLRRDDFYDRDILR